MSHDNRMMVVILHDKDRLKQYVHRILRKKKDDHDDVKNLLDVRDKRGRTLLHCAIRSGRIEQVKTILETITNVFDEKENLNMKERMIRRKKILKRSYGKEKRTFLQRYDDCT